MYNSLSGDDRTNSNIFSTLYMVKIKCYFSRNLSSLWCTKLHKLLFSAVLIHQIVQQNVQNVNPLRAFCVCNKIVYSYFKQEIYISQPKIKPVGNGSCRPSWHMVQVVGARSYTSRTIYVHTCTGQIHRLEHSGCKDSPLGKK